MQQVLVLESNLLEAVFPEGGSIVLSMDVTVWDILCWELYSILLWKGFRLVEPHLQPMIFCASWPVLSVIESLAVDAAVEIWIFWPINLALSSVITMADETCLGRLIFSSCLLSQMIFMYTLERAAH